MPDPLCEFCSKPFTPRSSGGQPQRFCSPKCLRAGQQRRYRARAKERGVLSVARVSRKPKPEPRESNDLGRRPEKRGKASTSEIDYSDAEREFLVAVDRFKRERNRPFPTLSELYAVLLSLGYEKKASAPC